VSEATRVRVFPDAEGVAEHAAALIDQRIFHSRAYDEPLHIALAGGATPRRAYELLAESEGSWKHVHLWLGDERCVPPDHPDSNARMVRESLLAGDRAEPPVLHVVPSPEIAEDAAWLYGLQLREQLPDGIFDIVLLGMGPDGHTCSLFPGHPVLDVTQAPVAPVRDAPKPPPERVTLTVPVIQAARVTLLLATGEEKRDALARALAGDPAIPLARLGAGLDEVACDLAASPGG
jgi:6-phosphogluconolactonase